MQLSGIIKQLGELKSFASGFKKREMVLLTEEQYPQPINIEFLTDKADLLNQYKEGEKVKVGINIQGREWTSPQGEVKYFNTITGWKIERNTPERRPGPTEPHNNPFKDDEDDDLPF